MLQDEILYQVEANPQNWMVAGRKCGHVSLSNEQGKNRGTRCFNPCLWQSDNFQSNLKRKYRQFSHHTALAHRFKDGDHGDMCATGLWVRPPTAAGPAGGGRGKH